jgi:hypothetical protein
MEMSADSPGVGEADNAAASYLFVGRVLQKSTVEVLLKAVLQALHLLGKGLMQATQGV